VSPFRARPARSPRPPARDVASATDAATTASARPADPAAAREAALRLLERRRRTRADLTRRLRDKGFETPVVMAVLDRLAAVGLVDDVEYARAFLSERWGRRAAGWRRIEGELRARGVSADDIGIARARFDQERGPTDAVAVARRAIAQAARRYGSLDPRVRRRRLYALLVRRGFDGDVIEQALREESAGTGQ
jgi:regulatory protein